MGMAKGIRFSMKEIKLSKGKVTIVDDCDYEYCILYKWYTSSKGYAVRTYKGKTICLHREILNVSKGLEVDHINGDRLDNRRENLRIVTSHQNGLNKIKRKEASSKYKGVHKCSRSGKYIARIMLGSKRKYLGLFLSEEEAAKAYNKEALKLHGEYASLNLV